MGLSGSRKGSNLPTSPWHGHGFPEPSVPDHGLSGHDGRPPALCRLVLHYTVGYVAISL